MRAASDLLQWGRARRQERVVGERGEDRQGIEDKPVGSVSARLTRLPNLSVRTSTSRDKRLGGELLER